MGTQGVAELDPDPINAFQVRFPNLLQYIPLLGNRAKIESLSTNENSLHSELVEQSLTDK